MYRASQKSGNYGIPDKNCRLTKNPFEQESIHSQNKDRERNGRDLNQCRLLINRRYGHSKEIIMESEYIQQPTWKIRTWPSDVL